MKVKIKSESAANTQLLSQTTEKIHFLFSELSRNYGFSLPTTVYVGILGPSECKKMKKCRLHKLTFGTAELSHGRYMIKFNPSIFTADSDVLLNDTIAEEVAHIAEALHVGRWSHGKMFKKMYAEALTLIEKGR